jgi:hypothetical protein
MVPSIHFVFRHTRKPYEPAREGQHRFIRIGGMGGGRPKCTHRLRSVRQSGFPFPSARACLDFLDGGSRANANERQPRPNGDAAHNKTNTSSGFVAGTTCRDFSRLPSRWGLVGTRLSTPPVVCLLPLHWEGETKFGVLPAVFACFFPLPFSTNLGSRSHPPLVLQSIKVR